MESVRAASLAFNIPVSGFESNLAVGAEANVCRPQQGGR